MPAHSTIQTGRPALFAGLALASGVGVVALDGEAGIIAEAGTGPAPVRLILLAGGAAEARARRLVRSGNRRPSCAVSQPFRH